VLAGAALIVSTMTACGGHSPSGGGHGADAPAAPSSGAAASGAVFTGADVTFAKMMIVHHRQAIEMADLAATRAADQRVRDLAAAIRAAQGPEIATMTSWLTARGVPTAGPDGGAHGSGHASMPGMMSRAQLDTLAGAVGATFDRQFLTMMIDHHEGAVTMAQEQLAKGSNQQVMALASKIVPDQRAEIATMRELLATP
jgi:uncharacterized protein (DUF305 family)